MTSTEMDDKQPSILDLPDHLLNDIGSLLDEKHSYKMEINSKALHKVLSRPSSGSKGVLQIEALLRLKQQSRVEASRWLQKRIKRYCMIECKFCECILGSESCQHGRTMSCKMPSLLPSLLAACGPSTGLGLFIEHFQGASFLALISGSAALGAGLSSFSAGVKQHLTELTLIVDYNNRGAQFLECLCTLTALQKLKLDGYLDLSGETLNLKLPHLRYLRIDGFRQGGLVLTCLNLAEAHFEAINSSCIKVEQAAFTSLTLHGCREVQFALRSAVDQLQKLATLRVRFGSEVGRHLIEDVGLMRRLRVLKYDDVPVARMPRRFPQHLQTIILSCFDWFPDVPKPCAEFAVYSDVINDRVYGKHWDNESARPVAELFLMDDLDKVQLAALEGVLTCTAAGGMEAKGCLLERTSERSYGVIVRDQLESKGKGKLLRLLIPRRITDGGNHTK